MLMDIQPVWWVILMIHEFPRFIFFFFFFTSVLYGIDLENEITVRKNDRSLSMTFVATKTKTKYFVV